MAGASMKNSTLIISGDEVVTAAEMKEIERKAADAGTSYYQMMENAGTGAADYISQKHSVQGKRVLIFCGKGNNGGDGFVSARRLTEKKALVRLILMEGEPKTEDAIKNKELCEAMGIPIYDAAKMETRVPGFMEETDRIIKEIDSIIGEADIIIDAVYGTGFHGELKELVKSALRRINASEALVVSLDIPSGLNGDTGIADSDTVRADETIVFHRLKPAHKKENAKEYCGRILCISIGI